MSDGELTGEEQYLALSAGVFCVAPPVGLIMGTALLLKKAVPASVRATSVVAKGTLKATGKLLKRSPRPAKRLTRRGYAELAKRRMAESLRIIESLPLDADEKEAGTSVCGAIALA